MSSRLRVVLTSLSSLRLARQIARTLVQRQLAACVHIAPIESVYRWQGRLHQEREFQLSIQTSAARVVALQAALRTLHPYELPAVYAVPASALSAPYARWVIQSCAPGIDSGAGLLPHRGRRAAPKGRTAAHP